MLAEVLYNRKSDEYLVANMNLVPLISDVRSVLDAISCCDYDRFKKALVKAEENSKFEYSNRFSAETEELRNILNFLTKFDKVFSKNVDESYRHFGGRGSVAAAGNANVLIWQEHDLNFEGSMIILEAFRKMLKLSLSAIYDFDFISSSDNFSLISSLEKAVADIYLSELLICGDFGVFGDDFLRIISEILQTEEINLRSMIRYYNPRLDKVIVSGILGLIHSGKHFEDEEKNIVYQIYAIMRNKGCKFPLFTRIRISLFLI